MGFLMVFLGAGLGGTARHGIGIVALRAFGLGFPWGTLIVNILGSLLMGLVIGLCAVRFQVSQETRLFLTTGFLGGFTTFSTFSLDTVTLYERGRVAVAALYVGASLVGGFAALALALFIARRFA